MCFRIALFFLLILWNIYDNEKKIFLKNANAKETIKNFYISCLIMGNDVNYGYQASVIEYIDTNDNLRFYIADKSDQFGEVYESKIIEPNVKKVYGNLVQKTNGRTMYPFRECLENMGVSVLWDGENKIAIGEIPGLKIEFPIGRSEYWVNGLKYETDVPSYVDEAVGRTYISIRYAAEGLGYKVDWKEGERENTINIYK